MTSGTGKPSELLAKPLELRRVGTSIKNRFMKSAMSEVLASRANAPTRHLVRLYERWASGGVGLAVTGNVMIDRRALGEPRNVVVEDKRDLPILEAWARAGTSSGGHLWMQLNHPGKQSPSIFSKQPPVAPSAIPFTSDLKHLFAAPRALTEEEIAELVQRFATSAAIAKKAGFTGVQLHGAHGYLVSQFLSPLHNQRTDRYGGSLENRMRFAVEILSAIRAAVGDRFAVGIKLNSADFQRGGFEEDDALDVVQAVAEAGVDLIEISGGNYEAPAMTGARRGSERTRQREAYFLAFAERARGRTTVPLAVTGGFRTAEGMAGAIASGAIDLVGLARPLAVEPDLPNRILAGEAFESAAKPLSTGFEKVDRLGALEVTWYANQLARMGAGKRPAPRMSPWQSLAITVWKMGFQSFQARRVRA